jgi:hypothetical protein
MSRLTALRALGCSAAAQHDTAQLQRERGSPTPTRRARLQVCRAVPVQRDGTPLRGAGPARQSGANTMRLTAQLGCSSGVPHCRGALDITRDGAAWESITPQHTSKGDLTSPPGCTERGSLVPDTQAPARQHAKTGKHASKQANMPANRQTCQHASTPADRQTSRPPEPGARHTSAEAHWQCHCASPVD